MASLVLLAEEHAGIALPRRCWRDRAVMADGDTSYVKDGVHIVRRRWGKNVSVHPLSRYRKYAAARTCLANARAAPAAAPIEN